MKALVTSLLLICLLVSCTDETTDTKQLTYNDFETSLQDDMDYDAILKTFGAPERDIGSGLHIYVYTLTDATEIWIGYADGIVYARHLDQDKNVLHTLIE